MRDLDPIEILRGAPPGMVGGGVDGGGVWGSPPPFSSFIYLNYLFTYFFVYFDVRVLPS